MITEFDAILRLLVALILGALVGAEREWRRKSAGLRTHVLVSMGSCLVMVISLDLYFSVQGQTNADPARLAAQVVSGIGFLGAGTIMKEGLTIVGLTTAASLWVVAAIGLAVGAGHYVPALGATVLSYLTLTWFSSLERRYVRNYDTSLTITMLDRPGQVAKIGAYLGHKGIRIKEIRIIEQEQDLLTVCIHLLKDNKDLSGIISELGELDGVRCVRKEKL